MTPLAQNPFSKKLRNDSKKEKKEKKAKTWKAIKRVMNFGDDEKKDDSNDEGKKDKDKEKEERKKKDDETIKKYEEVLSKDIEWFEISKKARSLCQGVCVLPFVNFFFPPPFCSAPVRANFSLLSWPS